MEPTTPLEALHECFMWSVLTSRRYGPGELVLSRSPEVREQLSKLTSDQIKDAYIPWQPNQRTKRPSTFSYNSVKKHD